MEHFISHWNQLIEENEKLNVVLGLALSTKLNKGKLVTILLYKSACEEDDWPPLQISV